MTTDAKDQENSGSQPLISVVTVVLNGARTLEATINSIKLQSFRDFEYIVLDGGSTDGTIELLKRNSPDIDFWTSERDNGIYNAWNKALSLARGEWIAFLGADDEYLPNALRDYADLITHSHDAQLHYVSSRIQLIKNGRCVRTVGSQWSWPAFSHYMTVAHVGSLHHRSLFRDYGTFDHRYRICGDYELLLRPRNKLRAAFLNRVTARMSIGGVSSAKVGAALLEQERAKRTTGGRAAVLCAFERRAARLKHACRSLLWY